MSSRHLSEPEIAFRETPAPAFSEKIAALRLELSEARTRLLQERLLHSVQRASAEQAYRVSESATRFVGTLLDTLTQSAFQITREGMIVRWNAALSESTGISGEIAIGKDLENVFTLLHTQILTDLLCDFVLNKTKEGVSSVLPGETPLYLTLIPQFRIPESLETVVVLISTTKP